MIIKDSPFSSLFVEHFLYTFLLLIDSVFFLLIINYCKCVYSSYLILLFIVLKLINKYMFSFFYYLYFTSIIIIINWEVIFKTMFFSTIYDKSNNICNDNNLITGFNQMNFCIFLNVNLFIIITLYIKLQNFWFIYLLFLVWILKRINAIFYWNLLKCIYVFICPIMIITCVFF